MDEQVQKVAYANAYANPHTKNGRKYIFPNKSDSKVGDLSQG